MVTIKGTIKNGVILPAEPLGSREGEEVLITLLAADEEDIEAAIDAGIDEVVARLIAAGPSVDYIPPKESLAEKLSVALTEEPIDSAEWNREWAKIEAEMKARDLADDRAEGRL
jgi:hypothetical protein